ncbi:MAG: AsmA family protein [Candidatus Aureabacteria bacterium]|nr:AsmA family protein [Candidatus Auribacterota bacterium]
MRLPSARVAVWILGTILVVLAALSTALWCVARTDWFLREARAKLEEGLGRKISFTSFSPSFLPSVGVQAKDFILYEPDGNTSCLQSKEILVRMKILPLLWRSVRVSAIYLDQPRVSLVRGEDGKWNFETLFNKQKAAGARGENASGRPGKKGGMSFSISSLRVKGGSVSVSEPSLSSPLIVNDLNGEAAHISGENLPYIDGSGRLDNAPLSDLMKGVKELKELDLRGGIVSGPISIKGWVAKKVAFKTQIEVRQVGFHYKNLYQTPESGLNLRLRMEGEGSYRGKTWDVKDLSAELLDGLLMVKGSVTAAGNNLTTRIEVRGKRFPWTGLGTLRVPGLTLDGTADLDAALKGTKEDMRANIALDCERSRLAYGAVVKKSEGVPASLVVPLHFGGGAVRWENASVRLADCTVISQGSLSMGQDQALKARISGSKLPLASVNRMLNPEIAIKGEGALDLTVEHLLDQPFSAAVLAGTATITGGEMTLARLANPLLFDVTGTCTPGNIRLGCNTARLGSSLAEGYLSFDMKRWPVFQCDLNFPVMDISDFSPPARPGARTAAFNLLPFVREADAAIASPEGGGFALPACMRKLEGGGRVTVGKLRLGKLRAEQGKGNVEIKNGSARMSDISLSFYGGEAKGKMVADLSGSAQRYSLDGNMTGVDLSSLLGDVYRYSDLISGKLSAELAAAAEGKELIGVKKDFCAKGHLSVAEGSLRSFGVMRQIGPLFSLLGQEAKCKEFVTLGDLLKSAPEETKLSRCEGNFVLQGARWGTGDMILEISEGNNPMRLKLDGEMGVDGTLKFLGHASVPRGSAAYAQLAPYFPDDNGWIGIPFPIPIGGTLGQPRIDPDAARNSVLDSAAEIGKLRLRKEIEKKIDRSLQSQPKTQGEKPNLNDVGRELLKGASGELLKKMAH